MEREAELEILQAKLDSVLVDVEEIKNRINNLQEEKQAADGGGSTKTSDKSAEKVPLSVKKIDFQTWLASKSQNIKDYTSSIDTSALHDKRIDLQTWISVTATNVQDYASGMEFSSINAPANRDLRVWLIGLGFPLFLFVIMNMVFGMGLSIWFTLLFWEIDTSFEMAYILTSIASIYPTILLYSHCSRNKDFKLNSDIFSEMDLSVVTHLFRVPNDTKSAKLIGIGFFADFFGTYIVLFVAVLLLALHDGFQSLSTNTSVLFLSLVIIAPLFEEILYRGLVLDVFFERYGKWTAIIISSILFAIAHSFNEEPLFAVLGALWSGLVYGYLRIETRSLLPGLLLHSVWNLHIVLFLS